MHEKSPHILVVFDCDGTLVDSQHNVIACMRKSFTGEGLVPPEEGLIRASIGLNLEEGIYRLMPEPKEAAQHARLVDGYRRAFFAQRNEPGHHEPLFPGALEALRALEARQVLMAVATGKSMRGLKAVIEKHDLADYFISLQTPDHNPGKPHPQMLEKAMADAGTAPENTFMIGDTSFDMMLAKNAGCRAIGVSWGYHSDGELLKSGADHLIHHFDELGALVSGAES